MANYRKLKRLGSGSQAKIYEGIDEETKYSVALKIISKTHFEQGLPSAGLREISILQMLSHENIIRLYDVCYQSGRLILVLELCDKDLSTYMKEYFLPLCQMKEFMRQLCTAMSYCHQQKVLHRDLKPQNILIKGETLKLADFGLSRCFVSRSSVYSCNVATLWYRAPELLLNQTDYSTPIDVWSLGCIFAEMALETPLFRGTDEKDQLKRIYQYSNIAISKLNIEANDLLSKMLILDPSFRITCWEALNHPFLSEK